MRQRGCGRRNGLPRRVPSTRRRSSRRGRRFPRGTSSAAATRSSRPPRNVRWLSAQGPTSPFFDGGSHLTLMSHPDAVTAVIQQAIVLGELSATSAAFRAHWERGEVGARRSTVKRLRHPTRGWLSFDSDVLHDPERDHWVMLYTARKTPCGPGRIPHTSNTAHPPVLWEYPE